MYTMSPLAFRSVLANATSPRLAGSISSTLTMWCRCSGSQWTVARLKAIYQVAIQLRAGNREEARKILTDNSIAYDHRTLIPKGVFGVIVRGVLTTKKDVVFRRLIGVLRIYTNYTAPTLTEKDWGKHEASITLSSHGVQQDEVISGLRSVASKMRKLVPLERSPIITEFKASKGVHLPGGITVGKSDAPYFRHALSLLTTRPPEYARYVFDRLRMPNVAELSISSFKRNADNVTGHISILRDRGMKTRAVAVPSFWWQLMFKVLHQQLDTLSKCEVASIVHWQSEGAYALEDALQKGKTLYCFDLSAATDRFPLSWQLAVLEALGLEQWTGLLREATRNWMMNGSLVNYEVGQPMGLYGSFPLFHLTHIYLLKWMCLERGVDPDSTFKVLGDDVLILDPRVARMYAMTLDTAGVAISTSKSVKSRLLGEFAGFLAVRLRDDKVSVFRPYKWSGVGEDQALMNLFHFLSKPVRSSSRVEHAYEKYLDLRQNCYPDLSPLIPEDQVGIPGPTVDATRLSLVLGQVFEGPGCVTSSSLPEEVAFELLGLISPGRRQLDRNHYPETRRPLTADAVERAPDVLDAIFPKRNNTPLGHRDKGNSGTDTPQSQGEGSFLFTRRTD